MSFAQPARIPLPPSDAEVNIICCEYCPVACGYKAYTWPVGDEGGPAASENALGEDFPTGTLSGSWVSQNMHNVITRNGRPHNVIVIPDKDIGAVNIGGEHSVRGGSIAKKFYNPNSPTADRYQTPLLRVGGDLLPIPWDLATDLVASLSTHVIDTYGELAWGQKIYSYQFYENTYPATKLALGAIGTPNWSQHHAPAGGADGAGVSAPRIGALGFRVFRDGGLRGVGTPMTRLKGHALKQRGMADVASRGNAAPKGDSGNAKRRLDNSPACRHTCPISTSRRHDKGGPKP